MISTQLKRKRAELLLCKCSRDVGCRWVSEGEGVTETHMEHISVL